MLRQEDDILYSINQILLYLIDGKMDSAIDLADKTELAMCNDTHCTEFLINCRKFITQYQAGAVFLHALANGNLDISPPDDLIRQNFMISQYKQLHSNLRHLTWQTQQIAKGDLKQRVSFLGEFSVAFNKMIESLREKQLMEEKIKLQNELLQNLNAEKDKFFSIIAHDLRSPFNVFLGFTKIMAERTDTMPLNKIQEMAVLMNSAATNLYSLLEKLLEWSQMQHGSIPFNPVSIPLAHKIKEVVDPFIGSAQRKEIEVSLDITAYLEVVADDHMLETVIRNLISNAEKFTPRGGKITIAAKPMPDNSVEISIKDTGIGMSRALIDNLFRIDVQTNRKGTEGEPSTGLGLIICKDFIEKNSGKIWVESEEAKGSTFKFTIPIFNQQINEISKSKN